MLGVCVITAFRDQQHRLSYQQQQQEAKRLTYPRHLPWALPSAPSQAAAEVTLTTLRAAAATRLPHACPDLPSLLLLLNLSLKCLGWLPWLAHTGHLLHRALKLHKENKCLR